MARKAKPPPPPIQLQEQPFIPPKRKPGDPPQMYGNDIPDHVLESTRFRADPLDAAFEASMAHIRETRDRRQAVDDEEE